MQVIVLAGGLGTRLRPLTYSVPKPMVPVLGKPYLYYQLDYLRRQKIKRALLLVGYMADQIRGYFGTGKEIGVELEYSEEKELAGTGGALKLAEEKIRDDFIVVYGDSFLPLDYSDFEAAFRAAGTEGMIAVYGGGGGETGVRKNVALSSGGLVEVYDKTGAAPGLQYVEAGILAFRRGVLDRIPPKKAISLEEHIYPELIREGQLSAYVTGQRFFDIGTEQRIRELEEWLRNDYLKDTV